MLAAHADGRRLALRTSGTTGSPRWVVRTTASWWTSFDAYADLAGIDSAARVWVPGPLTATMNLFAAVQARVAGAELITQVWPEEPERITHATLTPSQLMGLRPRLAEGCRVIVAGDRLSPQLADQAQREGLTVSHYYGASELSFIAWGSHAEDLRAFPGVEVESRQGVLWSRSAFHAEEPPQMDDEGWASVGDRGAIEATAEGVRVLVSGRAEDAITTAGATVLTADVEAVLAPHASARAAAVGISHPRLGQVVAVVLEEPEDASALRAPARDGLVEAAQPRIWFAGPQPWPTTSKGETDRHRLRLAAEAGSLRRLTGRDACPSPRPSEPGGG